MKNASMRQLRVFVAVARHASVSRAAEELHLTPPAVSMQLKELEADIGLPLFDRIGRTVSLTTVGEHLVVYAQRVLATLREADTAVARLRGLASGTLMIGMVSTAKYFLPRLLARFREEHPGIDLRLSLGNREALVRQLQGNEVDLAVMGRPPRELDTRAEPFAAHPHAVVSRGRASPRCTPSRSRPRRSPARVSSCARRGRGRGRRWSSSSAITRCGRR